MRQMRNVRTGKVAVYDPDLIETGRWEEVHGDQAKHPKGQVDEVSVKDEISVKLIKGTKAKAAPPKAVSDEGQ